MLSCSAFSYQAEGHEIVQSEQVEQSYQNTIPIPIPNQAGLRHLDKMTGGKLHSEVCSKQLVLSIATSRLLGIMGAAWTWRTETEALLT